jgi:putative spermidine/putrescine transport system permease protein
MKGMRVTLSWIYLALIYLFILGPMFFVPAASFNSETSFPAAFEGVTLRWYARIWDHKEFLSSAWTSTQIAIVSSAVAVLVAFLAAYAISRGNKRENAWLSATLAAPLLVPQVVMSLGMLQLASVAGMGTGFWWLVAVHAVHNIPFALRLTMTGFARFDFALEDAATSLGAGRLTAWREVTIPVLQSSIVAGFTFCFIMSFVNLPISLFLADTATTTLPVVMYSYIESRIDPMLAAVSAILFVFACAITLVLDNVFRIRLVD